MSTAEAVAVNYAACLEAAYLGDGVTTGRQIGRQLIGTVLKDNPDDLKKLPHDPGVRVPERAGGHSGWSLAWEDDHEVGTIRARLRELDAELIAAAREGLSEQTATALRREADAELSGFTGRMAPDALAGGCTGGARGAPAPPGRRSAPSACPCCAAPGPSTRRAARC